MSGNDPTNTLKQNGYFMEINFGNDFEISKIQAGGVIVINGETFHGRNITMKGDKIYVDGVEHRTKKKNILITIHGDVGSVTTTAADVTCNKAEKIETTSGDVRVNGDVGGNVTTVSGDVSTKKINGSVKTVSGDINKRFF